MSCYQFKTEQEIKDAYVVRILAKDRLVNNVCVGYLHNTKMRGCAYGLQVKKVMGNMRQPSRKHPDAFILGVCFRDSDSAKAFTKAIKRDIPGLKVRSTPLRSDDIRLLNYTTEDDMSSLVKLYRSMGF